MLRPDQDTGIWYHTNFFSFFPLATSLKMAKSICNVLSRVISVNSFDLIFVRLQGKTNIKITKLEILYERICLLFSLRFSLSLDTTDATNQSDRVR